MNITTIPSHANLNKDELKMLLTEVKETVAKEETPSKQSFGEVDIWKIRRSMKTARTLWDK